MELLDDVVLDAARGNIEYRRYVDMLPGADASRGEPKAALYIEFFGFAGGRAEVEAGRPQRGLALPRTAEPVPFALARGVGGLPARLAGAGVAA